jgi:uroporphyrinogen III methyltransferase/synthase
MRPRALVVRSGENPFPFAPETSAIEIVEKVSHTVVPLSGGDERLDQPAQLAIFTSQIAVRRLFEESHLLSSFRAALQGGRIAAVGRATANALRERGLAVAVLAAGSAEAVLEKLPSRLEGWRVVLPRGEDAAEDLPEGLIRRGAKVVPLVLYRKVPRPRDQDLDRAIVESPFAAFCATSPAAGRWLFTGIGEPALASLRRTPAVVLGRFTARFLASHGVARIEVAPEATFSAAAGLLVALAREVPGSNLADPAHQDHFEP